MNLPIPKSQFASRNTENMSESPTLIKKCSVTMMMSLYSDILNIVAGAFLNCFHIFGILLSIGYIILHLGSISYLIFYRKLGFRYHLKTCRILILVPQMFLLINSQVWIGDTSHPHSASFVPGITKICLLVGFVMSLVCMLSVIMSEYCVFNCREEAKLNKSNVIKGISFSFDH